MEDKNLTELQRRLNSLRSNKPISSSSTNPVPLPTLKPESTETSSPSSPLLSPEEELALNEEVLSYLDNAANSTPSPARNLLNENLEKQLNTFEKLNSLSLPSVTSSNSPVSSSQTSKPLISTSVSPIEILYLSHPSLNSTFSTSATPTSNNLSTQGEEESEDSQLMARLLDELSLEKHGLAEEKAQVTDWEERMSKLSVGVDLSNINAESSQTESSTLGEAPSLDEFNKMRKKLKKRQNKKEKKDGDDSDSGSESESDSESSSGVSLI